MDFPLISPKPLIVPAKLLQEFSIFSAIIFLSRERGAGDCAMIEIALKKTIGKIKTTDLKFIFLKRVKAG